MAGGAAAAPAGGGPTVLQVLPSLVTGGVERGTVDIAVALARAGWRALVASAGGPLVREIERAGGIHIALPLDSKNPFVIRKNIGRLTETFAAYGVDIVHARSRAPAWSAYFAARRSGVPFVTTFHAPYNVGNAVKRRYNSVMARGARVIAISEFVGRHVVAEYNLDPARLRVIPRGIDFAGFDPARVSAERVIRLARDWRLPDGAPVIMLPGRLTRWKGQRLLIEALAVLGRRDVCCLLVGSDQGRSRYRAEIESLVRARGLEGVVRSVDECRDMPAAYMLSDVVVSASTDPEGFGRVVAEAQAMGRPVVAPDHGGAPEILLPGETGWLFPPGNARTLAAALAEALTLDTGQRDALARRAIDHVRGRYGRDHMCASTLAVYEEVLAEAQTAATASAGPGT
ncbi:MAG: glycosyltransferase family 4 protein [Rhodospirillales bacterium]|nr:glycosyltransferase family 4 protein [Rhodospirillales bacterium]